MIKRIVLFICIFVSIAGISFATRISREEQSCPLCGTKFMASVVMSTNNFGGTDHDLCPHAIGSSPLSSYIWGCPYCNFCGFSNDFSKSYTDEEKNKIINWLKENYPPTIEKPIQEEPQKDSDAEEDDEPAYRHKQYNSSSLPSYKRYEIAAELAKLANKSNYEIGKLFLNAAWCARAHTTINKDNKSIENYNFDRMMRENKIIEEEGKNIERNLDEMELRTFTMADFFIKIAENVEKREITDETEKLNCYSVLAVQLRSSGENTKAEVFMKKAEQCKEADKFFPLFEGLRNSIKIEREYQSKVIDYLTPSLKDNLGQNKEIEVTLLLGEMNRRLEKYDEAKKYYSKLLENPESLPFHFLNTAKFALSTMGVNDNNQQEAFNKIEEKKIYSYLKKLSNPSSGREAATYLALSKRRDIIYPKLVEIINKALNGESDNSNITTFEGQNVMIDEESQSIIFLNQGQDGNYFTIEYATFAMTDDTKEAAMFLYGLLDKNCYQGYINNHLKELAYYLPSEKFIEKLNNATSSYDIADNAEFLKLINDKPSFEALITKAEKMFDDEGLRNLVTKKYPENNREACYALVESLAFFRGKRTVDFLVNLCERIKKVHTEITNEDKDKKISSHELIELYEKTGKSLEIMFFRHFGFAKYDCSRDLEPKKLEGLLSYHEIVEEPLIRFKEWYTKHENEDYKKIIYEGFKKYGYDIQPVSDPQKLYLLVEGLEDRFDAARIQCYKELVRRTGLKKQINYGLSNESPHGRSRESFLNIYRKWLKENISKLVYDEEAKKFIVK